MDKNNTFENFLCELEKGKKLVVFGAGGSEMLNCLETMLEPNNIKISYMVDNDYRKWNSKLWGYDVKEPRALEKENKDDLVVLVTSIYPLRIEKQLNDMGITNCYSSLLFIERHIGKQQFIVML